MTKILFLPHCLNKEQAEQIKTQAEKKQYEVCIVPGGSIIIKILEKYPKIEKIIGVACKNEIKLSKEYTRKLKNKGTIIKEILLSTDGCKNTQVNLNKVLRELK